MIEVRFKQLHSNAQLPTRGSPDAAGWDLYLPEDVVIGIEPQKIPLGIAMELPPGWEAQIRPRSSAALRGITVQLGTVDADYRGPLCLVAHALLRPDPFSGLRSRPIHFQAGDRLAQMVFKPVWNAAVEWVDELSETDRGDGGFGSTGR